LDARGNILDDNTVLRGKAEFLGTLAIRICSR
jgi:hypothetical protein